MSTKAIADPGQQASYKRYHSASSHAYSRSNNLRLRPEGLCLQEFSSRSALGMHCNSGLLARLGPPAYVAEPASRTDGGSACHTSLFRGSGNIRKRLYAHGFIIRLGPPAYVAEPASRTDGGSACHTSLFRGSGNVNFRIVAHSLISRSRHFVKAHQYINLYAWQKDSTIKVV